MDARDFDQTPGLEALFDLSFRRFVTLSVIKVVYVLALVLLVLGWLFLVIAGFAQGVVAGLGALVVGSIIMLLYLLFIRMWLELIVAIFRIAQNTSIMVADKIPTGGFPVTPIAPASPAP